MFSRLFKVKLILIPVFNLHAGRAVCLYSLVEVGGFAPPSEHLFLSGSTSLVLLNNYRLSARQQGGSLVRIS